MRKPFTTSTDDGAPYTPVMIVRPPLVAAIRIMPALHDNSDLPKLTRQERNARRRTMNDHGGWKQRGQRR